MSSLHEEHNLSFEYKPDNPIVTISLNREQMEKFAKTELKNNSLDSDAFHWLLTEATPEDLKKIEKLVQNEIWTLLTEGLHEFSDLADGLYEAYVQAYQASKK